MRKFTNFATILMVSTVLQSQTIIRVTPTGTGDGTSWADACNLEEAVVSTSLNDQTEIWVQKGTYHPTKMLVVPASVKIYGGFAGTETALSQRNLSANLTIIDGQKKIGSIFRLENSAEINGFTIQNGNANGNPQKNGGGVWADENCVIENCKIINNTTTINGGGVYAKGNLNLVNSIVENNTASGSGMDLYGSCITQIMAPAPIAIDGCNSDNFDFGVVSFETLTERTIIGNGITQIWSDAVTATGCQKTTYTGGSSSNYNTDCRSNPDYPGDLFSWCAVTRYATTLCPGDWRVPTLTDFINLDKALGGAGINRTGASVELPKYMGSGANQWGGVYGGGCTWNAGLLEYQGSNAYYWSQTEDSSSNGYFLYLMRSGSIYPQHNSYKGCGNTLRCVR